jgi:hypothetical protein
MPESKPPIVKVDAATLILVISAVILLPLLITGFLSQ